MQIYIFENITWEVQILQKNISPVKYFPVQFFTLKFRINAQKLSVWSMYSMTRYNEIQNTMPKIPKYNDTISKSRVKYRILPIGPLIGIFAQSSNLQLFFRGGSFLLLDRLPQRLHLFVLFNSDSISRSTSGLVRARRVVWINVVASSYRSGSFLDDDHWR